MASKRSDQADDLKATGWPGPVLSPSAIGGLNRSRVLQALCDHGPLTRADLARMADVPRATISGIVRPLLDDGLLEEGEPDRVDGRVGKPGRPLWFRRRAGLSAAVALRADGVEGALVSARGEILEHHTTTMSDPTDLRAVNRDIVSVIARVLDQTREEPLGIGLAVPGLCDPTTGTVLGSSQIPAFSEHALGPALAKRFGHAVVVDNDSRAQALGEKWFGDGRGLQTFAAIQTGHGLGVGLVLNGAVYRGIDGQVGEIGHTPVATASERCSCGLTGCWETIATLRWLRREARAARMKGASTLDAAGLSARAASGDDAAADLLERYAENLSIGLASLAQVFNPQRMILHGDVVGGGEHLRALIDEHARARTLPHIRDRIDIVMSGLDQNASLLGAAGLVLSETFHLTT